MTRLRTVPVFLLGLAAVVDAAQISNSFTTPGYPVPGQTTFWLYEFSIPQFNVPGGTLTRIDFELTGKSFIIASGTNDTGAPATFRYAAGPAFIPDVPAEAWPYGLVAWSEAKGSFTVGPGPFSFTSSTLTATRSFALTGVGNPAFDAYRGSGSVPGTIYGEENGPDGMYPGPYLLGPDGLIPGPQVQSAAQFTITYTYQAVPEPGTYALMLCGFIATGFGVILPRSRTETRSKPVWF